jgi:hypothetical protein
MIEPLNYLRQAQEDLAQKWLPFARRYHPKDAQQGLSLLQAARGAPKFVLPRGGRLLNDRLKGLPHMERVALLRKIKAMAPQPSGAERA